MDLTAVSNYPGAELVLPGLRDARDGKVTIGSCLISMARPLLDESGLTGAASALIYIAEPERTLYRLLQEQGGDAYSRYNSLINRLVSFERALRHARSRAESLSA